jgi:hypothetical protein
MKRIFPVFFLTTYFLCVGFVCASQVTCSNGFASPALLDFGTLAKGRTSSLTLTMTNTRSVQTFFFESSSGKLIFSDTQKVIFQNNSFSVQVSVPSSLPIGNFSDQVVISSQTRIGDGQIGAQKQVECRIPVQAKVISPLQIDKGSIDFGTVTQGQSAPSQTFKISALEAFVFNVSVDPTDSPITVNPKTGTLGTGGSANIAVTLNTQNVPNLTSRSRIIVEAASVTNPLEKFSNTVALFFNITAAATPPPGKPDLAFLGSLTIPTPSAGQGNNKTVTVQMQVQNIGTANSVQCSGEVLLDDVVKNTFTIPGINQGAPAVALQVAFQTNKSGTHNVKVKLDSPVSQVNESNENNNLASGSVNL